jgi:hypothetical protein
VELVEGMEWGKGTGGGAFYMVKPCCRHGIEKDYTEMNGILFLFF